MYCNSFLQGSLFTNNKSNHIQGNCVKIYKNEEYNAVVFMRHKGIPCIFCVPDVNFAHPTLVLGKRPAKSGYSTMTLGEDEYQKKVYHKEQISKIHKQFIKQYRQEQTGKEVFQLFQNLILPLTYDSH
jgi:hypothetical protein